MFDRRVRYGCAVLATTFLGATTVHAASRAAQPAPGASAVVDQIKSCKVITDGDARLACYDGAVEAFSQAEANGQVTVMDSAKLAAVKQQTFGFNFPTLNIFGRGLKSPDIDKVSLTVSSAQGLADDRWLLATSDGAAWRLTERMEFGDAPHTGSALDIRRGALGSFFCKIDKGPSVRCRREQ